MTPPPCLANPTTTCLLPALLACASLGGCASTAPSAELDQAAGLVSERSRVAADWQEPWLPGDVLWPPAEPLTADDVARLALRQHPGIRARVEAIARSRADFAQAHLLPNPVVQANLGFPLDGGAGNPAMGTLMQPLVALWTRGAAIDAAALRLQGAVLQVGDAALALVAEARATHARLHYAEIDLALEREAHGFAVARLQRMEERVALGEASGLERNAVALELVDAEMRVTDAEMRRDQALRDLLEVCGVPGAASEVVLAPPSVHGDAVLSMGEAEVMDLAAAQRLDLLAVRALEEGADAAARLAGLQRLRMVSVGLGYQRNFADRGALGPAIALELPIFDDGRAQVAKAESAARAAVVEAEAIRQSVTRATRAAWVDLRGAVAQRRSTQARLVALAADNLAKMEQSFAVGLADQLELLGARQKLVSARLAENRWALQVELEWHRLERTVGGRLRPGAVVPLGMESDLVGVHR